MHQSLGAAQMSDRDMPSARRSSAFAKRRGVFGLGLAAAATVLSAATPHPMTAQQQRQGELHANYQRQTQSKTDSWGAGAQVQLVWGAKHAPVLLGTSFGGDYLKQESNGPTAWNTSADVVLQPGGNGMVTP